jgi:hypothetical protein
MSDTLHTFHALSTDPKKGTHHFTTQSHGEAMAYAVAVELRDKVAELMAWTGLIQDAIDQGHGDGSKITAGIRKAIADVEEVLSRAGH